MTGETLSTPPEPLERRILNGIGALCGVVFWWVMLAQWIDGLPAPQELLEEWRDRLREQRQYRRAMEDTLADIAELPELELDFDEQGDTWDAM